MTLMTSAAEMVAVEERFLTAAFWMLCFCCVRMIVFMRIHPSISSITETFISVGSELSNFLFSFGLIFAFLAFIAHVRFGNMYDEFSTYEQSLITQFSLLIGDSSPDYTEDTLMCIFIIAYVFVCTLSLLNFLLAIVVNGYTQVTERVLENKVAGNFLYDLLGVPVDVIAWLQHRGWPSKLSLLIALQARYPYVFEDEEEVVVCMTQEQFRDIVVSAGKGRSTVHDADQLFYRYGMMPVLLITPSEAAMAVNGNVPSPHCRVRPSGTSNLQSLLGGKQHQPTSSPVRTFSGQSWRD
uniref:Polycystin cation channel PKD1/PKD2 domain-containing protein n=4 Tax=Tetraselmis chuii TaxID=63592 RepID=A0A7S1T3L9_9CHLO|mmetsp:Transcript_42270/g.75843  ORF Transcript_42270/g.75843 Transcript_42270/m.75843 type:complete len:296 (+) Transcript_42270:378-1265(+)